MMTATRFTSLLVALLAALRAGAAPPPAPAVLAAMQSIAGRRALADIKLLASSYLAGRKPGEDGFDLASTYVRAQYEAMGLAGGAKSGSFTQDVRLRYTRLGDGTSLAVHDGDQAAALQSPLLLGDDYLPLAFSAAGRATLPVTFVGYGIVAPEHGWDDYRGVDVRGRAVLVLRHEPREKDPSSRFDGKRGTAHARLLTKARLAQARGAAAILFVTGPLHHDEERPSNSLARWPELDREEYQREGRPIPDGRPILADRYAEMTVPAVQVSARVADRILGQPGGLLELQKEIDQRLRPRPFAVTGRRVALDLRFDYRHVASHNVLARLEGRDPLLRAESVILCGHLDHLGRDWRGQIHPGADDNASGTAGILEVARAMASLALRPLRSVLFVNTTAEEMGLLGAYQLVADPPFDLGKVVGVFNLDMIGRNTPGEVNLVGKQYAPDLHARLLAANLTVGLRFKYDAGAGAARSDNFPFWSQGVPAMSLFTGTHEDYHEPGDTASKLSPGKIEAIARLVFLAAHGLADDPAARAQFAAVEAAPQAVSFRAGGRTRPPGGGTRSSAGEAP